MKLILLTFFSFALFIGAIFFYGPYFSYAQGVLPAPVITNVTPSKFIANPALGVDVVIDVTIPGNPVYFDNFIYNPSAPPMISFDEKIFIRHWFSNVNSDGTRRLHFILYPGLLTTGTHTLRVLNTHFVAGAPSALYTITVVAENSPQAKDAAGIPRPPGYVDGDPIIVSVDPPEIIAGSPDVSITVSGGNFSTNNLYYGVFEVVRLYVDGIQVASYVSQDGKTFPAVIPASFLLTPKTLKLQVVNRYRGVGDRKLTSPIFSLPVFQPLALDIEPIKPDVVEVIYHQAPKPVIKGAVFEGSGSTLRLRVDGSNFEDAVILVNNQPVETIVTNNGLVGEISADLRATLVPGKSVGVRVQNGLSQITIEGNNFPLVDGAVVVVGANSGREQSLPSRVVIEGRIEADLSSVAPGDYVVHVASGVGENRTLSPGQKINIPKK